MSSRIQLTYRKVCETCNGEGIKITAINQIPYKEEQCPDCTEGYTIEIMQFNRTKEDGFGSQLEWISNGEYQLWYDNERAEWWIFEKDKYGQLSKRCEHKLHPISLEVIEEKECPECDGFGNKDGGICTNCESTGEGVKTKIEEVTSTTFFGSMKERDAEIVQKGRSQLASELQDMDTQFPIDNETHAEFLERVGKILQSEIDKGE